MSKALFGVLAFVLSMTVGGCTEKRVFEGEPLYLKAVGAELPQCRTGTRMLWENIHYVNDEPCEWNPAYDYRVTKVYCLDDSRHIVGPEIEFDPLTGEKIHVFHPNYGSLERDGYDNLFISYRDGGRRVAGKESTEWGFCGGKTITNGAKFVYAVPCGQKID